MKKFIRFCFVSFILCFFLNSTLFISDCKAQCKANFLIIKDSTITHSPYGFLFYDESTGTNIYSWEWNFGDSLHSISESPVHTYAKAGKYIVCLTIKTGSSGNTTCTNKYCSQLTIDSIHPASCNASFYYFRQEGTGNGQQDTNTYYFIDNSAGDLYYWSWNFGDGTISNDQNPQHTFKPGATYNICLTVNGKLNDTTDCQSQYCEKIIINKPACYADFIGIPNVLTVDFNDASTGNPDKWYWDFGDGGSSEQQLPSHTYAKAGIYNVCLTIKNDNTDCEDMRCSTFYVGVPIGDCEAAFTFFPDTSLNQYNYDFINISKGNPKKYSWDFGDKVSSPVPNPTHIYSAPGIYNVCLTVSDSTVDGCNNKYCQTIFVSDKPSTCKAFFTDFQDTTNITPNFFRFADKSTGNPLKWTWDFGDNTSDTTQNPTHAYKLPGVYYVCLTITNLPLNCTDIYCSQVVVGLNNGFCHAEFSYNIDQQIVTFPGAAAYNFTDNSAGNVTSHYWDFGDGTSSSEQNPQHIFYPGNYKVCLSITSLTKNTFYCSDNYCAVIFVDTVTPPPANYCKNYFTYKNNANDTLTLNFHGNALYSQPPISFLWSFGDNIDTLIVIPYPSSLTSVSLKHHYNKSGQYSVILITVDSSKCTYTSTQTINVGTKNTFPYISGQVFASGSNMDKAAVILGSIDLNTNSFTYLDTSYVDTIGGFRFNKVPYGTYNIFSIPLSASKYFSSFVPTYAGDSWDWLSSTFLTINELTPVIQHNINLKPYGNITNGPGSISGFVTYGGMVPFNTHYNLGGIEVLLFDLSDRVLDFKTTDDNGIFRFSNLAYGTYKVFVEIWGMYSTAALVTIGPTEPNVTDLGFSVNYMTTPFSISLLVNNINPANSFNIGNIYPNPLNSTANINVTLTKPEELNLSVYNSIGQLILIKSFAKFSGNSTLQFDAAGLPSGLYNAVITIKGNTPCTRRFVKR